MIFAAEIPHGRALVLAQPMTRGYCPSCGDNLMPKCGTVNVWHWAHRGDSDCDQWAEGETEWHIDWKNNIAPYGEVERILGNHRADAIVRKTVIEFQHSAISADKVLEREQHYKEQGFRVLWVIDLRDAYNADRFQQRWKGRYNTFKWLHARKAFCLTPHAIIADFGGFGFDVQKIYPSEPETWEQHGKPATGWGYFVEDGCMITSILASCGVNLRSVERP